MGGLESVAKKYYAGIDIGASSIKYAVLDEDRKIVYSGKPLMHFANPLDTLKQCWQNICSAADSRSIISTSFTGEGAKLIADTFNLMFEYDSVAIPKGAKHISPDADYDLHLGAKNPYFFEMETAENKVVVKNWSTGTKCGGGSGLLVEKQSRRLFGMDVEQRGAEREKMQEHLEEVLRLAEYKAESAMHPSQFLARCGVVIQSDMIHCQNDGAAKEDNIAGMFNAVPVNYISDVIRTKKLSKTKKAIMTGGLAANNLIKKNLENILGMEIEVPDDYDNVAAIGAALKAIEEKDERILDISRLYEVREKAQQKREFAPSLHKSMANVIKDPDNNVNFDWSKYEGKKIPVVLGVDGGSTTTKIALVNVETGELMDKMYIETEGDPLGALRKVLKYAEKHKDRISVQAVATTGSARAIYDKILVDRHKTKVIDSVIDEITCHASGVKHNNRDIDTINEMGGQDMKYTRFKHLSDEVEFSKMNYSCQAGAGQTMANLAEMIGLNVIQLNQYALRAERVPVIDHTCGVFMEIEVARLISEGFSKEEIAASIVRATVASYVYKFIGGEKLGDYISAQGGPALGDGVLAAMAQVTGKKIYAFRHREMFGAWGAGLKQREEIIAKNAEESPWSTGFRGWEVSNAEFRREKDTCGRRFPEKTCGKRNCSLEAIIVGEEEVITGGGCTTGNTEKKGKKTKDYVQEYQKMYDAEMEGIAITLDELMQMPENEKPEDTVGIKRSTTGLGTKGIWAAAFFSWLGLQPVISPVSDEEITELGVANSHSEYCIAMKLAIGHAAKLKKHVDYMYNPSFIDEINDRKLKYCIYVESEGFVAEEALNLNKNTSINPILHFNDSARPVDSAFYEELRKVFGKRFSKSKIREAIRSADSAEQLFERKLSEAGDKFLEEIAEKRQKAYVGIARDYVNLDPKASSETSKLASDLGYHFIPLIFLKHLAKDIDVSGIAENMFWKRGRELIQAAMLVANHPLLYPVYQTNFGCGTDTMIYYSIRDIMDTAKKPMLVLQTDAHDNNAPFRTRWEANYEIVKNHKPGKTENEKFLISPVVFSTSKDDLEKRIWIFPYMGDGSRVGAAAMKAFGIDSIVAEHNTQEAHELARKHVVTDACLPLKGVVGDITSKIIRLSKEGVEPNRHLAVLLPSAEGPCRFGQYRVVLRKFLDKEGFTNVPIISPLSVNDYADIPVAKERIMDLTKLYYSGTYAFDILYDSLLRTRPYESLSHISDATYNFCLDQLVKAVESGDIANIMQAMKENADKFEFIDLKKMERKPKVLYAGEIYMRWHDEFTQDSVRKLEGNGLEVMRQPLTEWISYINGAHVRRYMKQKQLLKLLKTGLKRGWMKSIDRKIRKPFAYLLEGREFHNPMEFIEAIEEHRLYHGDIEGESPLSIGLAHELMHNLDDISGFFHVGPWMCMQETTATAKINAMTNNSKIDSVIPILHASFGDSPNLNLDAEIAVFMEQCYARREQMKKKRKEKPKTGAIGYLSAGINRLSGRW